MNPKKLWEYNNQSLFEVDMFHHSHLYESWHEFCHDEEALSCNCIYGNPLLYWYWDNNDENEDDIECIEENFKKITFIYRSWFSEMAKIEILVSKDDEPLIREFIHKQQLLQTVYI
jgi:hypothetical protein